MAMKLMNEKLKDLDIQVIRSGRKSLSLQIRPEGVIVRAPYSVADRMIRDFVNSHTDWILANWEEQKKLLTEEKAEDHLSMEDLRRLADEAVKVIPERVRYYAPLVGVTCGKITIRNQKSRWGSCSAKGNLSFNCLLMLMPPEVIDSVVVHELCHRKEMNHSERFYREVLRVFPEYWKCYAWLRDNGTEIMRRMTS